MHLLAAQPGHISDGKEAVDLGQTPGDIIFASAADTELSCMATAHADQDIHAPSLRLANLMQLSHNLSVDLWIDKVIKHSKLVIIRILGGINYWPYGVESLVKICKLHQVPLAFIPGDDKPDPDLTALSSVTQETVELIWNFLIHGGKSNALGLLEFSSYLINNEGTFSKPQPLPKAGYYWPSTSGDERKVANKIFSNWKNDNPVVAIIFYRALLQAGNMTPINKIIEGLKSSDLNPLPIFVSSLRDAPSSGFVQTALESSHPTVIINACAFSVSTPEIKKQSPLDKFKSPVIQIVFAGNNFKDWQLSSKGLGPRDIAMHVALPEVDGRLFTRAVAFKTESYWDRKTQTPIVSFKACDDRINFVTAHTAAWARLAIKSNCNKKIAIILANYPNKNGRIGNGVGLDTPASVIEIISRLKLNGYNIKNAPKSSKDLMDTLVSGVTNNHRENIEDHGCEYLSLKDYKSSFDHLPKLVRSSIVKQWRDPTKDSFFCESDNGGKFILPIKRFGNLCVIIQPARGYNIDPVKTYHDPSLVPPHGYLAVYFWIRKKFSADAVLHVGKHGNLEWLPGKSLALSETCYPEIALGEIPNIYPFIVNDPGEGSQAKRRAHAVIIDHLTPPMTRADSYGSLAELETLVDEYFDANHLDERRLKPISKQILSLIETLNLGHECGILPNDSEINALAKLDGYLCEIKEMQIRDGLHVFGQSPKTENKNDFLLSLTRIPRGTREEDASITQALSHDLKLGFDPLDCDFSKSWEGKRLDFLGELKGWRTIGDTVERLEKFALELISGQSKPKISWNKTKAVLNEINTRIGPAVDQCGEFEIKGIMDALNGNFIPPGPSGAPSRGRPEVLPTGRNFYSVDTRNIPTQAAWSLGWKSAQRLCEQYAQEHGEWPLTLALNAWGTACMRTGGDDIAQALALIGTRPTWDIATGRVSGFEIISTDLLDRPRVDVTLRISGFFRDAFPSLIELFDSATRAVAKLKEPPSLNPHAAQVKNDVADMKLQGLDTDTAIKRAGYRIFGSMPGSYGAGLQALIDEGCWDTQNDIAEAYTAWSGWAYGKNPEGIAEHKLFEKRLTKIQAIVQNQDNREHDLLDSDDYYQFEGGLAAAVKHARNGVSPSIYHNDHSNPSNPKIRSLQEEISRVIRGRATNPKWIKGVMRHGYKGAFEIAATLDYLFAFAATTNAVKNYHFDQLFEAYFEDNDVREFIGRANPYALKEMAARFREAVDRGLWQPRSNHYSSVLSEILEIPTKGNMP